MAEIHYATPGAGKRLAVHVGLVMVAGMAVIAILQAYQPALLEWASRDPAQTRRRAQLLIALVGLIVLAPLAGFAIYIWRLGTRTLSEGRFPPEGLGVIRDVLVVRGPAARARGRLMRGFASVVFVVIALMALVLLRLATLTPQP